MRGTLRQITLAIFVSALFCVVLAQASPTLEGRVGLGDRVVANRYAPITVVVSGLSFPVNGRLQVVQRVGNAWRGEASASIEIASGVITNGTYSGVIPVYEPANPLSIRVVNDQGSTVIEADLILRDAQESAPFSVSVGRALPDSAPEVRIAESDLPSDWAALDAVSTLWIGGAPSRVAWDAIATWVLAGGSVVVGTGSDFFRIDSPLVRDLLPIETPSVTFEAGGAARVIGELKSGATILLSAAGSPVAVSRRYGAGHVAMVSTRLSDLTADEALALSELLEPASIVSLDAVGEASFERLEISRPQVGAAVLLGITATILFTVLVTAGRKHPRAGIAGILAVSALLSVSSGLYINRTKPTLAAYAVITNLQVRTMVGYYGVSSYFVTMHPAALRVHGPGSLRVRMDYTPDPQRPNYDSYVAVDQVVLSLPPGQAGGYSATGVSARSFDFQIASTTPRKVRVTSWLEATCPGVLLADGVAYRLPSIEPGEWDYALPQGESIESLPGFDATFSDLYQQFLEDFTLGTDPWLLLLSEETLPADREGSSPRTRIITLHAQRGGTRE